MRAHRRTLSWLIPMLVSGFTVRLLTDSLIAFVAYLGIAAVLMLVRPDLFPMDRPGMRRPPSPPS